MTSETATPRKSVQRNGPPPVRTPRRRGLATGAGVLLTLALSGAILVAIWDWNWVRGPVAAIASAQIHRKVTISGDLRIRLWSWQPSATADGVRVANPAWAGRTNLAEIDRIAAQIRLVPLFAGHLDLRLLQFVRPRVALYRDAQGRATWDFSDGLKPDEPLRLPPIRTFIIDGGQIDFRDEDRKLSFSGTIGASERLGADNKGFQMTGRGVLNGQPFDFKVIGGPLMNIDRNHPYPFNADIHAGATYVTAQGAIPKPFDLAHFYTDVTARGPDLAELYGLTGVPLPNTPPYILHGRLSRDVHLWKLNAIGGRMGSSDLAGALSIRTGGARPFLTADFQTGVLAFPDLGPAFGGGRKTGKVASPKQIAVARKMQAEARIFPEAKLNFERIRKIDADVTYWAASITDAPIHLKTAAARIRLDAGLLRVEPLELTLPQGRVTGHVLLDARAATAITDLDLKLSNARLEGIAPIRFQGAAPLSGPLSGRARLHGTGDSLHDALGDAYGDVALVATGGEIRRSLAELAGVDITKGLGLLFAKDKSTTRIRCAVVHFKAVGGVLNADRLVIDTDPVLIDGGGTINLDTEELQFRIQGHPKSFRLVRLNAPISFAGPILHPRVSIEKGHAMAQGGMALVLAAVVSPLAAILPFVDAGLTKDANCGALIAEGGQKGAPDKSAPLPGSR